MASDLVPALNESNFTNEITSSTVPVIVDFTATWCGPCQRMAPVLDQLATENAGKIKIFKVDADENQNLLAQFGVRGVPTFVFFGPGSAEEKDRQVGPISKDGLLKRALATGL